MPFQETDGNYWTSDCGHGFDKLVSLVSLSLGTPTTPIKALGMEGAHLWGLKGRVVVGCAESFPQLGLEASLRGQKRKAGCL